MKIYLYLIYLATLSIALIVAGWLFPAQAHQAPTGWAYPITCCSNQDCREVAEAKVIENRNGFTVPSGELIHHNDRRLKDSPDGAYHWCTASGADDGKTLCLFVPPRSY